MPDRKIRLYTFDAGKVLTRRVLFTNQLGEKESRDLADPNHCYLIQHPDGLLMWDAGLPDSITGLPDHTLSRGDRFRFVLQHTLAGQLQQAGFHPERIPFVAYSHLQIDHAGNAGLFPNATVFLQAAEYEMAFGPDAEKWGYRFADYASLATRPVVQLAGDHDVFGDGRVMIFSAPGHTPGHQVLLVRLSSGAVLLSGDLYYASHDPETHWMPQWNYNREETLRTMVRMQRVAEENQARWMINHNPDAQEQPQKFPQVIE